MKVKDTRTIKPWDYSKYELARDDILEGYKENADKVKYLYHPLQFFNLMTFLKGNIYKNTFETEIYKEFYWKRKFLLDDYIVKKINPLIKSALSLRLKLI